MALGDLLPPALDDLVGGLPFIGGGDRFSRLFNQEESDFKQFGETKTDRRRWAGVREKSSPEYFFLLKYGSKTIQVPFKVNPQRETVSHPHSMTSTKAQGGGKIVNSEGMTEKDIVIQGSCGLYPGNKKSQAPTSGIGSGLEQLKFLETLFQRYCFLKRYGDGDKTLQLVYVNRRFQDAWVVEPKTFTREDAVEHNFNFGYTIVLETQYPYNGSDAKSIAEQLTDLIPFFSEFDQLSQGICETVDNLNALLGEISAIANGFTQLVMGPLTDLAKAYADIATGNLPNLKSFKKDSTKALIANLQATANALEAAGASPKLVNAVITAEKDCKSSLLQDKLYTPTPTNTAASIAAAQQSQAQNSTNSNGSSVSPAEAKAVGASITPPFKPDLLFAGVTSSSQGAATVAGSKAVGSAALQKTSQDPKAIEALKKTDPALAASLKAALDAQKKATATSTVGNATQNQSVGSISMASPAGSAPNSTLPGTKPVALSGGLNKYSIMPPSTKSKTAQAAWVATMNADLAAINPANATYKTALVGLGDDIKTLAFKLLGDPEKWPQLVMLNNLTYPYVASKDYISANGTTNVIAFGDPVIFPAPKTGESGSRVYRTETGDSLNLSPFERALGNDWRIDPNTGDIIWGANDVTLVYGVENISQFIRKRFTIRKGFWRRAIRIGFTDFLGDPELSGDVIMAEAQGLFIDDDRIESCEVADVQQQAQNAIIVAVVKVRDIQQPITVTAQLA